MWRDAARKELAAQALRITAADLTELGCVDGVIPEPEEGAHTDHDGAAALLDAALWPVLEELKRLPKTELLEARYRKFRNMAQFYTTE